jgi:hypothetical protein
MFVLDANVLKVSGMLGKVLFTFHTPKTDNSFSNSPSHIIIDWHLQKEKRSWKTKCPTIKKYSHGLREQNQHQKMNEMHQLLMKP